MLVRFAAYAPPTISPARTGSDWAMKKSTKHEPKRFAVMQG
jgi:hypothetical protein